MANGTYQAFDPQAVRQLALRYQDTFKSLAAIEEMLNTRFHDMQEPILALILAVASGEPLLFVGPPGTGKSRLIRVFCDLVGLIDMGNTEETREDYFEYLLTPFTEPTELFGYFDIVEQDGVTRLIRNKQGSMQRAQVVFLDEVFNGSSAILNSLLTFINEGIFHDRGKREQVELEVLFGATNDIPQSAELRAVYDRFLLRSRIDNVPTETEHFKNLLEKGWVETYSVKKRDPHYRLLSDLRKFRKDLSNGATNGALEMKMNEAFVRAFIEYVSKIRRADLSEMSNRRLVKMVRIMLIHAIYEAVKQNKLNAGIVFTDVQLKLLRFAQDERNGLLERAARYETEERWQ